MATACRSFLHIMKNQFPSAPLPGEGSPLFEVREFIRLRARGGLLPVRHYRTVLGPGGEFRFEPLSVKPLLTRTIAAFDGICADARGNLSARFPTEADARACAEAIADHHGRPVQVYGTEVLVFLKMA
jgi:hypothetical protein